jgi:hypothetical protein
MVRLRLARRAPEVESDWLPTAGAAEVSGCDAVLRRRPPLSLLLPVASPSETRTSVLAAFYHVARRRVNHLGWEPVVCAPHAPS